MQMVVCLWIIYTIVLIMFASFSLLNSIQKVWRYIEKVCIEKKGVNKKNPILYNCLKKLNSVSGLLVKVGYMVYIFFFVISILKLSCHICSEHLIKLLKIILEYKIGIKVCSLMKVIYAWFE